MKALVTLLLAVALAGCGSGDGGDDDGDAAAPADAIELVGTDFEFDPPSLTLDGAGQYTLRLANEGESPHALAFDDLDAATETIQPGESAEVEVELEPGRYTIFCPVGDHRERGMEGTVVVGGAGAGGGATTGEDGGDSEPADDDGYGYG